MLFNLCGVTAGAAQQGQIERVILSAAAYRGPMRSEYELEAGLCNRGGPCPARGTSLRTYVVPGRLQLDLNHSALIMSLPTLTGRSFMNQFDFLL